MAGLPGASPRLLGPDTAPLRQFSTGLLCAAAAVIVQAVLGLDRRVEEHTRRTENLLTGTAAAVRDSLQRLERHDEELRGGLTRQSEELRSGLTRQSEELRGALNRHTEHIGQLVESRVAEVARPADPYPGPDRVRIDSVPELAKSFAEVLAPQPPILYTFVRLEMKRVVGHMSDLTNLSAECPGENHDWMLSLTRAAEQSVCATSTSVDRQFWNSEPASRYLQAQHEAIEERGVSVRRVFLLESARELDDRLLRLCEEQELLRIEVRVAVLPELPPHLQRGTTNDFIVYDEEASFEIDQDLRDVNVRTRLIARQDHVQDRMKRFRELWDAGMGVRELEVRVDDEEDGTWMVDRG
ncbi:membrane protein [Streptomyces sp. e14]|nr:membrane protein [Streptomyces sp. e14]